jgi:Skp family chaperone for outer membrane proteins
MEDILKKAQSNLNIDEVTQQKDVNRYKEIQQELMKLDNDFNRELKNMSNDLQTKVFDQLSEIITEWSTKNSINLVMGKMEIIFNTNDIDATEDILNIIKEKGLYYADAVNAETIKPIQ